MGATRHVTGHAWLPWHRASSECNALRPADYRLLELVLVVVVVVLLLLLLLLLLLMMMMMMARQLLLLLVPVLQLLLTLSAGGTALLLLLQNFCDDDVTHSEGATLCKRFSKLDCQLMFALAREVQEEG
jgi:hypothetical protein